MWLNRVFDLRYIIERVCIVCLERTVFESRTIQRIAYETGIGLQNIYHPCMYRYGHFIIFGATLFKYNLLSVMLLSASYQLKRNKSGVPL